MIDRFVTGFLLYAKIFNPDDVDQFPICKTNNVLICSNFSTVNDK